MQSDVYGALSARNKFTYQSTYDLSNKHTTLEATFDSIFVNESGAKLYLKLHKGKKKKSKYLIEAIEIISESGSSNPFIDSLCEPYLNFIKNQQSDSIAECLFPQEKIDYFTSKAKEIKSQEKREKAMMSLGFISMSVKMVKKQLESIDTNAAYKYASNELKLEKMIPTLTVRYVFINLQGEEVLINLNFQSSEEDYKLTGISFSKSMNAMNIE